MSSTDHRGAIGQRQGETQMRNLNAQQYTYIPPSTPMNRQMPARTTASQRSYNATSIAPESTIWKHFSCASRSSKLHWRGAKYCKGWSIKEFGVESDGAVNLHG
ncbi:hypothetical protein FRC12_012137 [Ceratobasidium sp. 428]|nr:hypothetical protein FRC12_012137 [Ceratobasidium sp. 428]